MPRCRRRDGYGAPPANAYDLTVALAKRKALLARRSAQGPPWNAALLAPEPELPVLEGTPDAPITWLFEPESFAPLAKLVAEERYSIVTDHLGTPRAMYDERGAEAWAAETDTYGALRDVRGTRRACPFRFPGQYEDAETGLYYNRFRYYDPEAGGYVSQDPIGLAGGIRPQTYVRDPVLQLDPLGLSCKTTDKRVGPASHFERFGGGASVLLPKKVYDFIRKEFGALGRTDGLYVMRKVDADRLSATGNNAAIRKALGIPDSDAAWHGPLVQIDIPDPLSRKPRMPTGLEEAANKLFKPGGYTSGGTPEMVIDPVPWHNTTLSAPFGGGS